MKRARDGSVSKLLAREAHGRPDCNPHDLCRSRAQRLTAGEKWIPGALWPASLVVSGKRDPSLKRQGAGEMALQLRAFACLFFFFFTTFNYLLLKSIF